MKLCQSTGQIADKQSNRGFSLVELMVAIALSAIVMAFFFSAFFLQNKSYGTQEQVTQMQQNLRAAMYLLGREIRAAGYDPKSSADATILIARVDQLQFQKDDNEDGDITPDDTNEQIMYYLTNDSDNDGIADGVTNGTGDPSNLRRKVWGDDTKSYGADIAENIEAIEFRYTLADGTQTTAPAAWQFGDIRATQVWILARTSREVSDFPDTRIYTTPSGITINNGPFDDNFRRRVLMSTFKCRNMP